MWLNDNSDGSTFRFVDLPNGASSSASGSSQPPAFVIDSTGSESFNYLDQNYPNGVQIRQFDSSTWYFTGILGVKRWLTPENVQTLSAFSDAVYTPGPTTINGVNLGSTSQAYALRQGSAAPLQVTYPGGSASANNPGNNWSAVAAAPTSTDRKSTRLNSSHSAVSRMPSSA